MKVLVVADIHYSLRQFDWLLQQGPRYDVVIIAGDLLDLAAHVDMDTQVVVVNKYLAKLATLVPVVVSSGNHDLDSRDAAGERVAAWMQDLRYEGISIDGDHVRLPGALITVCPWWDGPIAREALEKLLRETHRPEDGPWIWIHHGPPSGSPVSWTGKADAGDSNLTELIGRWGPDFVLSGHIHDSPFRRGGSWVDRVGRAWVFNPGRQIGPYPAFIELDLAARTATWISLAGQEDKALDDAAVSPSPAPPVSSAPG
ncbi:MAG: metallophosphoesterase [Geminicoccaceae bacterium]